MGTEATVRDTMGAKHTPADERHATTSEAAPAAEAGRAKKSGHPREDAICTVCGRTFPAARLTPYEAVRPSLGATIAAEHPEWQPGARICQADLERYRRRHLEALLEEEGGELGRLEREVLESLDKHQFISQDPEEMLGSQATFGDRMADRVATWGGSWIFILSFSGTLVVWMALNVTGWLFRPFDPYPFILLNLVLSTLAALQAPIIMMSQRRQEAKDRLRAENDYRVNLKAELEIRQLHEKIDHQIARQWEHLSRLQQLQIELLEDRRETPPPRR